MSNQQYFKCQRRYTSSAYEVYLLRNISSTALGSWQFLLRSYHVAEHTGQGNDDAQASHDEVFGLCAIEIRGADQDQGDAGEHHQRFHQIFIDFHTICLF